MEKKKDKQSAIEKRLQKMEIRFDQGEEFVVVDMGSGTVKVGFSGEDLPRVVMPTVMGEMKIEIDPAQSNVPDGARTKILHKYGNEAFLNQKEGDTEGGYDLYQPM